MSEQIIISAQPGPQTMLLSSPADIAIFGGSAGGGKSFALLLDPLAHIHNPKFTGIIFRKTSTMITSPGALWDASMHLYSKIPGAVPRVGRLDWTFPSGARIKFSHLQHEQNIYDHQGAEYVYIGWDELTHFSATEFFYLMSRLRSTSGIPGYVRATCNPDCDSFVKDLIQWYLYDSGDPHPDRAGKIRWFIRRDDALIWGDKRKELLDNHGQDELPKSFTFIPSKLTDNVILMEKDPSYLSNLKALSRVDRMRLLGGNWNVKASSGLLFRSEWFPIVDAIPSGWRFAVRSWDRAGTKVHEGNKDPDWTRGMLLYKYPDNSYVVADIKSIRDTPGQVESLIKNVATHDSNSVRIISQQDPGSAGVLEAQNFVRMLQGFDARTIVISKDKITRAKPVSAQAEVGNIRVLRAPWNKEFFDELENFPDGSHDDIVDVLSLGFNELCQGNSIMDVYHLMG